MNSLPSQVTIRSINLATARQAFHHGLKTVVLRDGVSSFDSELHNATLKNLAMKFGVVMTSEEFLTAAQS
ncbi:isochorismatase family protein [candidate division KSB3 bacterium]|uniref:Isochorismatase family protein n=1 Tax=candidate division KSB3 bacterium TaxID=2044937 RepID=A0A9D5K0U3_9BACT|nr:isochorismatase family protein [candidate division KSB3 bacterium]MBD3327341.1 isochorismatase family protein [candidate division KSB3 bacterium]